VDHVSPALSHDVTMPATLKYYWRVTKPGILFGNLISIAGGYFLASKGHINMALLLSTAAGISLVIASGCVFNNYVDRNLDRKMARTRGRALAAGLISPLAALLYASALGVGGMCLLWATTNLLTVAIVLAGFTIYVGIYSVYLKRHSVYAPLIGSLAGATPPLAGYCAVSNHIDLGAAILFMIFSLWQMPHFYAIAIYRLDDYAAAAVPVLPLRRGVWTAKKHIMGYVFAFTTATLLLTVVGYTGYLYFVVALVSGLIWMSMAWAGYKSSDDRLWARKLFTYSIVAIFTLSIMMSIDFARPASSDPQTNFSPQVNATHTITTQAITPASLLSP